MSELRATVREVRTTQAAGSGESPMRSQRTKARTIASSTALADTSRSEIDACSVATSRSRWVA